MGREACQAMGGLYPQFQEVRLWWTPRHVDLDESDVADMATKHVAQGIDMATTSEELPQRLTTLNSVIHRHYATRLDVKWDLSSTGRQIFDTTPHLSRSMTFTKDLTRKYVPLVAQFLSGHYSSNQYLFRFHIRDDPRRFGCDAPFHDPFHRFFHCPPLEFIPQKLKCELLQHRTEVVIGWS